MQDQPTSIVKAVVSSEEFPLRNKDNHANVTTHPIQVDEKEDVNKTLKEEIIRKEVKDVRLYLVRFKNKSADNDLWLETKDIKDSEVFLRRYRASKRNQNS